MLTDLNLGIRSLTFVVLVLGVEVENRSRVRRKFRFFTVKASYSLACHVRCKVK